MNANATGFEGGGAEFLALLPCCCGSLLALAGLVFWVWMLVDSIRRDYRDPNEKIIWVLVIVLLNFLGAVIYFFVGRGRGAKEGG